MLYLSKINVRNPKLFIYELKLLWWLALCLLVMPIKLLANESIPIKYAWVQLGSGDSASVRAIISSGSACPALIVGNTTKNMRKRVRSPRSFSNISVCEYAIKFKSQLTSSQLKIGTLTLPVPTTSSDEILVVGDTGCRGGHRENCATDWGWPAVSKMAAKRSNPDVILHVGDYHYRERCGAFNCGYTWAAWEADFFKPAEKGGLLREAPWMFVRGNHESCGRAWAGFLLFFAEGPLHATSSRSGFPTKCDNSMPPYKISLDQLDIYMVDTSDEDSHTAYDRFKQVNTALSGRKKNAWLATHVPIWHNRGRPKLGSAFANSGLENRSWLRWVHVGHTHLFEHHAASNGHQAMTLSGGSGTKLDSCYAQNCYSSNYSYMVVSSKAKAWEARVFNQYGKRVLGTKPFTVSKY